MTPRRRVPADAGMDSVRAWAADPGGSPREVLALAVRFCLDELVARHPGATCEVRVPPFGVVQCLDGPRHRRGTPPNVVETDPQTWLGLATGATSWSDRVEAGAVRASGERSDLSGVLPLWRITLAS